MRRVRSQALARLADSPSQEANRDEERPNKVARTESGCEEAPAPEIQAPPSASLDQTPAAPVPSQQPTAPHGGYWHRDGSYHDDVDAVSQSNRSKPSWADLADEEDEERRSSQRGSSTHSPSRPSPGFSRLKVVETSEFESEDEPTNEDPWGGAESEEHRKGREACRIIKVAEDMRTVQRFF